MVYKFNDFKLNESALKDAKMFADNQEDKKLSNELFDSIRKLLDTKVKSKYCHKKDNFHLALLFIKIAFSEDISVFSLVDEKVDYYDDKLIDYITQDNENTLETLLCYILKYDSYLNYLPIKPITAYTEKNVKRYHQQTEGNINMSVYETLTDHIVRYLPIKLQANDWVKKFPSKLKSDYKQNQDKYDIVFISTFNTYNSLPNDEKKSIFSMYFGTKDENGKISKFNSVGNFLEDFKNKLGATKSIDGLIEKIAKFGNGIDIVYNNNNILVTTISTHKASVEFGNDTTWCISDSDDYQYQNYCGFDKKTIQYFVWDFNKDVSDEMFRIGITVNKDGTIETAHDKTDGYISNIESYFKNELKIPFKKIIKPLSKRELNKRQTIEDVNKTFENLLTSDKSKNPQVNYNKVRNYFIKYKDIIDLNDDVDFFRKMIIFGDVELIKYSIEKKLFKFHTYNNLAINLAYEYSEKSYEYLFDIDDSFKCSDYKFLNGLQTLFGNIKNKEDFKKLYNRFEEVNKDGEFNLYDEIFKARGFIDKIIKNDNIDLLKFYVDEFNYKIPERYNPDNISSNMDILSYVYAYGKSSDKKLKKPDEIAKYLIHNGYQDNDADYTISLYKLKPEFDELLNKVVSNGYDKNIIAEIFEEDDIEFELLDLIDYEYKYDKENFENEDAINRFFSNKSIADINKLLSKNINYIYSEEKKKNYHSYAENLKYYLEKEKNLNNVINLFHKFPQIFKNFSDDNIDNHKNHYNLFFKYSTKNKIFEIFESTIKYSEGDFEHNFKFDGEDSEFIKVLLENDVNLVDDVSNFCDIYYNYDYDYKDLIVNKFSDVEFLKFNLAELLEYDKNRELLNTLKNKGIITPKLIKAADITIGIYVKSIETIEYLLSIGGKPNVDSIADYITYGIDKEKNETIEESDLKIKKILELLHKNGASFQNGRYSEDTGNNVENIIKAGLYHSTKYAIESGAKYRLETVGRYSGSDRVVDNVIACNNIKMFNYFKDVLKIEFRESDYDINITNSRYKPNIEFFDTIFDYAISHDLNIDNEKLFMNYLNSDNIKLIKHVFYKMGTLNSTDIIRNMCTSYRYKRQNIEVIKWLVEEEGANYDLIYDELKRKKTLKSATRDYFKYMIKKDKLKESKVFSFSDFVSLIK